MSILTTLLESWWNTYKEKETILNGPFLGFILKKDEQTVIIFGESHNSQAKCDDNESILINVFDDFVRNNKGENIDLILELKHRDDNELYQLDTENSDNRIINLFSSWKKLCKERPPCHIDMNRINILGLNTQYLKIKKVYEQGVSSETLITLIRSDILGELGYFLKDEGLFNDLVLANKRFTPETKRFLDSTCCGELYTEAKNCYEELKLLKPTHTREYIMKKLEFVYFVGLHMMDYFTIMKILTGSKSIIVYEGAFHSIYITAYLMKLFGYKLLDCVAYKSLNCSQFKRGSVTDQLDSLKNINYVKHEGMNDHIKRNLDVIIQEYRKQ